MQDILNSVTSSINIVRKLRELNRTVSEADFKMLLADLLSQLSDAKVQAADLKDQIVTLREENGRLKQAVERREKPGPELHEGAYIFGGDEQRHYCTSCWDRNGLKILLYEQPKPWSMHHKWGCPDCHAAIGPAAR